MIANQLIRYDQARAALYEARSVDDVKDIKDKAEALLVYARQTKDSEMEAWLAEIKLRAMRRIGELSGELEKAQKVGRGSNVQLPTGGKSKADALKDAGISKSAADRCEKIAEMPEDEFDDYIAQKKASGQQVTATEVYRKVTKEKQRANERQAYDASKTAGCTVEDLTVLATTGQRFSVIYADPPWEFKVYSGKGKDRSAERHYDTEGLDAIKALPVAALAADDCALFLWGVWPELPGALGVIESWGFTYKTAGFVWVKQNRSGEGTFTGMGYWTRANSEPCLLATRGSPHRLAMDVPQVIFAPVGQHSQKPEETRARIERLLAGPYLELFGRSPMPDWTVWGNEIDRASFHEEAAA